MSPLALALRSSDRSTRSTGARGPSRTAAGLSLAALLLLAGCGSAPDRDPAANAAVAAGGAAPAPAAPAAPPAAAIAPAQLVLEGKGLKLVHGKTTALPFGSTRDSVEAAIALALGGPPAQHGVNGDCGSGAQDYAEWKDLTAWFQDGQFVGWDDKGKLRSAGGLGLGTKRVEIADAPGFEVSQSTIGTEFMADGMSGLLDSKAPTAKVKALWAGETCIVR